MAKDMKTRKGKDNIYHPYTSPDIVIDANGKSATNKFEEISSQFKKYENYKSDEEKESVKVRRKEFVEKQKIIHKDIKDRISYLNQYERN